MTGHGRCRTIRAEAACDRGGAGARLVGTGGSPSCGSCAEVARTAAKGDPFRRSNVTRLRWLGAIFLLGFPLATFVERVLRRVVLLRRCVDGWTAPAGGIATGFPLLSGPAIMAAVCLFALAEVFAYGARLREDVDATI